MAITAFLAGVALLGRRAWGVVFALFAGSVSSFFGLMDTLFDLENGICLRLHSAAGADVGVQITINVLTLTLPRNMVCLDEDTEPSLGAFPRISEHSRSE